MLSNCFLFSLIFIFSRLPFLCITHYYKKVINLLFFFFNIFFCFFFHSNQHFSSSSFFFAYPKNELCNNFFFSSNCNIIKTSRSLHYIIAIVACKWLMTKIYFKKVAVMANFGLCEFLLLLISMSSETSVL